jgi:hypothetical protein
MDSFRTSYGRCEVTDDELRIHRSVRGTIKRIYEGSKLFFFGLVFGVVFLAFIVVYVAPSVAIKIVLFSTLTGLLLYFLLAAFRISLAKIQGRTVTFYRHNRQSAIPLDAITSIECYNGGLFPRLLVQVDSGNSESVTHIQFPYRWFSYTMDEYETAQAIFKRRGITVKTR